VTINQFESEPMKYVYFSIFFLASIGSFGQTSWVQKGGPLGGNVQDVEYYPGTSTVWALVGNRPYKSTDDGATWTLYDNATLDNFSIYDIEITNNTIYFLGYYELFTSTDQGATVQLVSDNLFSGGRRIKRLPVSGALVILSSNGTPDIYYSTNNGVSWTTGYNAPSVNTEFLAVNSVDQVFILVGTSINARPYRSTDSGLSFTEQSTGIPAGAVYSIENNNGGSSIYAVYGTDLYTTTNGLSWSSIKGGNITDAAQASASSDPSFFEFTADGQGMYFIDNYNHKVFNKTVSGAASTWTLQASTFPNTATATWPTQPITACSSKNFPSASSNVVFGTTYGIIKSATGGASTVESNTGITQVQVNETMATAFGSLLLMTNDLGMMVSSNSGDSWSRVTSLPTNVSQMTNVVTGTDPTQGMTQLALGGSTLYRSTNEGSVWSAVTTPTTFSHIRGADNNRAFGFNSANVYYSNNGGSSFAASPITFTPVLPAGFIDDLIIPTTSNVIYAQVYNTSTSTTQYYKITFTYDGSSNITTAATSLITAPSNNPSSVFGANGKIYAYNSSSDNVQTYNGTSWSALRTVPNGSNFTIPAISGYMFVSTSGSPGKIQISRDDGVTFTSMDLPSNINYSSVYDITVSPQGYAFLTINEGFIHQSKNIVVLPTAPSGVAEVGRLPNAVVISWIDNANNETAYRIMRSTDGVNYTSVGTIEESDVCGNTTTGGKGYFTDNTVAPSTIYRYKVKAVNDAGEAESSVLTLAATPAAVAQTIPDNRMWIGANSGVGGATGFALQTPEKVGIQHLGNGRYRVSDVSINTVTSSAVEEEFYVNGTSTLVGGSPTSSSSYQVKANGFGSWNGIGTLTLKWLRCSSNPTQIETITYTLQANDDAPATPVLQALITGSSQVELSWVTLFYAKNYILERSTTSASTGFTQLGSNIAYPATSTTDNTVTPGTTYYYRLKARNGNAAPLDSPYSPVITVNFQKPNFIVSATTVSTYVSATVGSYWADFDGDGNDDLLTINGSLDGASLSTITIFKNLANGNFEIKSPVLDLRSYNFGSVSDINGDGLPDLGLAVSEAALVDFYKSNGDFTFTKFTAAQLGDLVSAVKSERTGISWADINNDGRLDAAMAGEYDALLNDKLLMCVQNANGTFTAIDAGDLTNIADDTFTVFWADVDNDGFVDALVGDSGGLWKLFKNLGNSKFHLMTPAESGIDANGAIGGAFGDINNDGFLDLFVGVNGNNLLYINDGDGTFTKNNTTTVTEPGFVVEGIFADINNDGLQDLIVPGYFGAVTRLYINTSTGSTISFNRIVSEKMNDLNYWHIGAAVADYDKNGFVDLAMGSLKNFGSGDADFSPGENYLFKNNNSTGNWSEVKLIGVTANKSGVGAKITVTAGGKSYTREVASPGSFVSLSSATQHFGLGSAGSITSIQIKWPTTPPSIQIISNPTINTLLTITQDTYPPTVTLLSPAASATGVLTSTTLEITFNEAATAVSGKKLTITPTDASSSPVSIDVTAATVSGNKFTFTLPAQLAENKHYDVVVDAGAFVDVYQNATAAISSWGFTTTDQDAVFPVFGNLSSLPTSVDKASLAQTFSIPITDNKAVVSATMFVKSASGSDPVAVPGSPGVGPLWQFALSASAFDAIGVQYFFTAKDAANNVTRSPVAGVYKTQVKYTGTQAQVPASLVGNGGAIGGWKVIAVPFDLGANNGIQTVFDELTGTNKVDYRIVTYTETPAPAWVDYLSGLSTIDRGVGYFVNIKSPVNLIIGDNLVAPQNSRDNLYKINLKAGWNMIGNPYLEAINWGNVVTLNSLTGTATTFKKFSEGAYSNATTIAAYEGGFVHADAAVQVSIPFNGQTSPGRTQQITFGPNEWLVPIAIQQGEISNSFCGVGMHSTADLSFDALDDINGPHWIEFTEMNFKHPEHMVKNFARDVVPVLSEHVWEFTVDTNMPGVATLKWDNETHPIDRDLYLYDESTQTPVNMKEVNSYAFDSNVSSKFKVYYGDDVLSKIKPTKVMLGAAYPNPTSAIATVPFSIPERGTSMSVRLEVFDMTGKRIGTLANGSFAPGFYNGQWEPQEGLSAGLYFFRLVAGDEVFTGKIALKK